VLGGGAQYPLGPIAIKPVAKGFTEPKDLLHYFFSLLLAGALWVSITS